MPIGLRKHHVVPLAWICIAIVVGLVWWRSYFKPVAWAITPYRLYGIQVWRGQLQFWYGKHIVIDRAKYEAAGGLTGDVTMEAAWSFVPGWHYEGFEPDQWKRVKLYVPSADWPPLVEVVRYSEGISYGSGDNEDHGHRFWIRMMPMWMVGATLLIPAIWIVPPVLRRIRLKPGSCKQCGYDLRATPERCPECGAIPENHPA